MRRFSGRQLRELRIERGFDRVEALCVAIGYSFHSVQAWETDKVGPSRKALLSLSSVLDCRIDDLLMDEEVPAGAA